MLHLLVARTRQALTPQGWVLAVALLLATSIPAQAGSVLDFKSTSSGVINNRANLTKFKPQLKPSGGGTVVPLHRINKTSPWAAAASLVAIGATIYFEDELNDSLAEILLGNELPDIEGWDDPDNASSPPDYTYSTNWGPYSGELGEWQSSLDALVAVTESANANMNQCYLYSTSQIKCWHMNNNYWSTASITTIQCTGSNTTGTCIPFDPGAPPLGVWPDDGISMLKIEGDTLKFWDAETNTFSLSDPLFYATPEGVGSVEIHAGNVAKIHEWLEINDAAGNTQTVHEYVTIDGNTGAIIASAQETIDKPIDEAIESGSGTPVEVVFPDFMNVKVDETGTPTPPADGALNYTGTGWGDLTASMNVSPTLPTLNAMPSVPSGGGACQTIDLGYKSYPLVFPSSSQCSKLHQLRDGIGWLFYILTAFYLIMLAFKTTEAGAK